ncbi:ABC transporter [Altererythrobacter indicus]|uniref:ABC transporter n=1 Tax=Altericroceibacterium indicum TaxID=374177 RepID=A0A845A654_9SPHN|nr:Gldg family protein [Altericroceibacterium indicum]MXP25680.1 ABC transporter [Altericroceibacterium indicum]
MANAAAAEAASSQPQHEKLALMGTIPIYWGEAADLADVINGTAEPHWARAVLEETYELEPVSLLDAEVLSKQHNLLLAQPRALSPSENVALDDWVRDGGHVLIFADPMMTGHSNYPIGDRRRPQDVILLSPILQHWGLSLSFDESQSSGVQSDEDAGVSLPVQLAGSFALQTAASGAECKLRFSGLLADCQIGAGRAMILADAALLNPDPLTDSVADDLRFLMHWAYATRDLGKSRD